METSVSKAAPVATDLVDATLAELAGMQLLVALVDVDARRCTGVARGFVSGGTGRRAGSSQVLLATEGFRCDRRACWRIR